jgi:hypothetical protein
MTNPKTILYRLLVAVLAVFVLTGCEKYAVLISTGNTTADNSLYHSEYWYDLFLQYQALRDNGFDDNKIYVLYGNGTDFATAHADYDATAVFGHSITDKPVSKANVQAVFNDLVSKVGSFDYLYVWWMGHGGGSGPGSCDLTMHIATTGETVTDAELATYMNAIGSYNKRSVTVMTCHSGGMLDNFNTAGSNTLVLTSSTCPQYSSSTTTTCNHRGHAELNYTHPTALREKDPCGASVASDSSGNGLVSLGEAHDYNLANVASSTPQLGDPDGIAGTTEIAEKMP